MSVRDPNQRECGIGEGSETKKIINHVYPHVLLSTDLYDLIIVRCGCLDAQLNRTEGQLGLEAG